MGFLEGLLASHFHLCWSFKGVFMSFSGYFNPQFNVKNKHWHSTHDTYVGRLLLQDLGFSRKIILKTIVVGIYVTFGVSDFEISITSSLHHWDISYVPPCWKAPLHQKKRTSALWNAPCSYLAGSQVIDYKIDMAKQCLKHLAFRWRIPETPCKSQPWFPRHFYWPCSTGQKTDVFQNPWRNWEPRLAQTLGVRLPGCCFWGWR